VEGARQPVAGEERMDAGKVGTTHHLLCFGRRNTDTETRASLSLNLFVLFCFWREREEKKVEGGFCWSNFTLI
jgi:hypothetical protein